MPILCAALVSAGFCLAQEIRISRPAHLSTHFIGRNLEIEVIGVPPEQSEVVLVFTPPVRAILTLTRSEGFRSSLWLPENLIPGRTEAYLLLLDKIRDGVALDILPDASTTERIEVQPSLVVLPHVNKSTDLKVFAVSATSRKTDITSLAVFQEQEAEDSIVDISSGGTVVAQAVGTASIKVSWEGHSATVPVTVADPDFWAEPKVIAYPPGGGELQVETGSSDRIITPPADRLPDWLSATAISEKDNVKVMRLTAEPNLSGDSRRTFVVLGGARLFVSQGAEQ